jgi:hypothetical protein
MFATSAYLFALISSCLKNLFVGIFLSSQNSDNLLKFFLDLCFQILFYNFITSRSSTNLNTVFLNLLEYGSN